MSPNVQSMVWGPSVLYVVAFIAAGLTLARKQEKSDPEALGRITRLYLLGIACQSIHFIEEFVTGFQLRLPPFLGLVPWSNEFFVTFNLSWIALWVVSVAGLEANWRIAFFPAWFFAIAMVGNSIWHPLLSLATGGYFPGLFTSPIGGVFGVLLVRRLCRLTATPAEAAVSR